MEKNETFEMTFIQYDTLKKMITNLESELAKEKTCRTCKHKSICLMAQKAKDSLGTKLNEQWFSCYETE